MDQPVATVPLPPDVLPPDGSSTPEKDLESDPDVRTTPASRPWPSLRAGPGRWTTSLD